MPVRTRGLDGYLGELRAGSAAAGVHRLQVRNPTGYAEALQDKDGYEVIDEGHMADTAERHVRAVARSGQPLTAERVDRALDAAGFEEVGYLRSLTGETTDDGRQRHPGYWADVTGVLSNGYSHEVNPSAGTGR